MTNMCPKYICNFENLKEGNPEKWLHSLWQVQNAIMCNEYNVRNLVNSDMIVRIIEIFNFPEASIKIKTCICYIFTVVYKTNYNSLSDNVKNLLSENFISTVSSYWLIQDDKLTLSILYLINAITGITQLDWKKYFQENKEILSRLKKFLYIRNFKNECFVIPKVFDTLSTILHDVEMVEYDTETAIALKISESNIYFISTDIWEDYILLKIFEYTFSEKINYQIAALNLLSILVQEHSHVVYMMMKITVAKRFCTEILIYNTREHVNKDVQVRSCIILAHFYMAISNRQLYNLTICYTIPALCRMCNIKYDAVVRILAGSILHLLLKNNQELCIHTYQIENIAQTLIQIISTSTPIDESDNLTNVYGYSDLIVQNAFNILSSLTDTEESIRTSIIAFKNDLPILNKHIIKHLKSNNWGIRIACTYFLISLSRSPILLRKFFIDNEYATIFMENIKEKYPYNLRKLSLCCLCNLVLHLSYLRHKFLDPNLQFIQSITAILVREDDNLKFHALWILMNLMHTATEQVKIYFVNTVGLKYFMDIIMGDYNTMIQEKTIALLINGWKLQEFQNYFNQFINIAVSHFKFQEDDDSLHVPMMLFLSTFCNISPCRKTIFQSCDILEAIETNLRNEKCMNISIACIRNLARDCTRCDIQALKNNNIISTMKGILNEDVNGNSKNMIMDVIYSLNLN
ncbi:hypothetical protein A3Q56_02134 [Intoshia linei]|uniref:Armadillo repeat-containing protein 8 n=1 Tax=Intoshia linei TaxID=1819745 RepID=A0A177B9J5_9BILA|nr:hypothetical protein A3Q56_02134 [Intoshia linei]